MCIIDFSCLMLCSTNASNNVLVTVFISYHHSMQTYKNIILMMIELILLFLCSVFHNVGWAAGRASGL